MENNEQPIPFQEIDEDERQREDKQDFADDRFKQLELMIHSHGRNPDKSPFSEEAARSSALGLHRWIDGQRLERNLRRDMAKSSLKYIYRKDVERETLGLQKKTVQDLAEASKILRERITAALQFTELGETLEKAYYQVKEAAKDHPDDPLYAKTKYFLERTNYPNWPLMRDVATALSGLIEETAHHAFNNLSNTKAPMGQPPKLERDKLFYEWHQLISADLATSMDESTYIASDTWQIYFPEETISEEAAIKILSKQRNKIRESSASSSCD